MEDISNKKTRDSSQKINAKLYPYTYTGTTRQNRIRYLLAQPTARVL